MLGAAHARLEPWSRSTIFTNRRGSRTAAAGSRDDRALRRFRALLRRGVWAPKGLVVHGERTGSVRSAVGRRACGHWRCGDCSRRAHGDRAPVRGAHGQCLARDPRSRSRGRRRRHRPRGRVGFAKITRNSSCCARGIHSTSFVAFFERRVFNEAGRTRRGGRTHRARDPGAAVVRREVPERRARLTGSAQLIATAGARMFAEPPHVATPGARASNDPRLGRSGRTGCGTHCTRGRSHRARRVPGSPKRRRGRARHAAPGKGECRVRRRDAPRDRRGRGRAATCTGRCSTTSSGRDGWHGRFGLWLV